MSEAIDTAKAAVDKKVQDLIDKATASLGASKAKLFAPILSQYGPIFAKMTEAEVMGWLDRALHGDPFASYLEIAKKMDSQTLVNQWGVQRDKIAALNEENVANLAYRQKIAGAILEAMVSLALAAVGL